MVYRPEAESAGHQRDVMRSLVAQCADLSLALVVEPIWYPLPGEDTKSKATPNNERIGVGGAAGSVGEGIPARGSVA